MNGNIMMGFWHNWPSSPEQGCCGGAFREVTLTDIPQEYNVIAIAFMNVIDGQEDPVPDFKPYKGTESEFRQQIEVLHNQGRQVIISLGGAESNIELHTGDELALAMRIKELVDKFDFDGLDIALDQKTMTAADNKTVIPTALRMVKDYYRALGQCFMISMTPEFPSLNYGGGYTPWINALEGYYDFIVPQYYNQGSEGVLVDDIGWIVQNSNATKENFLYYLTESLLTGTRNFIQIPHDKLIIGLPANADAAATGYVADPQDVTNALARLKAVDLSIRGLMAWSVNWDTGTSSDGKPYNWEFIQRYGDLMGGGVNLSSVPDVPEWRPGLHYTSGDVVCWNEKEWLCAMPHDSDIFWTPERSGRLWNPC